MPGVACCFFLPMTKNNERNDDQQGSGWRHALRRGENAAFAPELLVQLQDAALFRVLSGEG
jgi:hypothetical protein